MKVKIVSTNYMDELEKYINNFEEKNNKKILDINISVVQKGSLYREIEAELTYVAIIKYEDDSILGKVIYENK